MLPTATSPSSIHYVPLLLIFENVNGNHICLPRAVIRMQTASSPKQLLVESAKGKEDKVELALLSESFIRRQGEMSAFRPRVRACMHGLPIHYGKVHLLTIHLHLSLLFGPTPTPVTANIFLKPKTLNPSISNLCSELHLIRKQTSELIRLRA